MSIFYEIPYCNRSNCRYSSKDRFECICANMRGNHGEQVKYLEVFQILCLRNTSGTNGFKHLNLPTGVKDLWPEDAVAINVTPH